MYHFFLISCTPPLELLDIGVDFFFSFIELPNEAPPKLVFPAGVLSLEETLYLLPGVLVLALLLEELCWFSYRFDRISDSHCFSAFSSSSCFICPTRASAFFMFSSSSSSSI